MFFDVWYEVALQSLAVMHKTKKANEKYIHVWGEGPFLGRKTKRR